MYFCMHVLRVVKDGTSRGRRDARLQGGMRGSIKKRLNRGRRYHEGSQRTHNDEHNEAGRFPTHPRAAGVIFATLPMLPGTAQAQAKKQTAAEQTASDEKPNILFIMGDDIGWMQPSIYHRGLMVGETPNIDRIGQEG